jgi:small basic protein
VAGSAGISIPVLAYYDAVFALGHRLFDAFALARRKGISNDGDLPAV